jgi:hypothetical protein
MPSDGAAGGLRWSAAAVVFALPWRADWDASVHGPPPPGVTSLSLLQDRSGIVTVVTAQSSATATPPRAAGRRGGGRAATGTSTARPMPRTSGSPTPSAPRTPGPSSNPATRETTTARRHPEMPGQRHKAGADGQRNRSHRPRPWVFPPRPWTNPGAHGRIADGRGPRSCLGRRMCWSAPSASARSDGL